MRILHFADLHLGVENYGRVNPETGLSTRLEDFLATLDEVVDYTLSEGVDLVIFAGDAYKSRDPSQTQQREFAKRLSRLSEKVPIFLLVGNHDLPMAPFRATTMDIFQTLALRNIIVGHRLETFKINTPSGPVQVVGLPWPRRSLFLAREELRGLPFPQIKERLEAEITQRLLAEVEKLDRDTPAVLAAHLSVASAIPGSEWGMGQDFQLLPSVLAHPSLDYVALGHIHRHQVLGHKPSLAYSGSLQRVDFNEEGEDKGFYTIELDPRKGVGERASPPQFHSVKARPFVSLRYDLSPEDERPIDTVLNALNQAQLAGAVVRVFIHLSPAQKPLLDLGKVRQALQKAYYVAGIHLEMPEARRPARLEGIAEGLTPLQALRKYLEAKRVSPERMKELIAYGEKLAGGIFEDKDALIPS